MPERLNPSDLCTSVGFGFSHAVVSRGGTTVHCAGQAARDRNHTLVGAGDPAARALPGFLIGIGATAVIG